MTYILNRKITYIKGGDIYYYFIVNSICRETRINHSVLASSFFSFGVASSFISFGSGLASSFFSLGLPFFGFMKQKQEQQGHWNKNFIPFCLLLSVHQQFLTTNGKKRSHLWLHLFYFLCCLLSFYIYVKKI